MDAWQFIAFVFWHQEKFVSLGNVVLNVSLVKMNIFKLCEDFNVSKYVDNGK
jgi:hypothetical protein